MRVSVGTGGGGSFHLENPGLTDFGDESELRCQATSNGNSDKFSAYNFTPATSYYMHFLLRLDNAADGVWFFCNGNGNSFESDAAAADSQIFSNLLWNFGAGGTIASRYRDGGSWINLPPGTFQQGLNYTMDLYCNNTILPMAYVKD